MDETVLHRSEFTVPIALFWEDSVSHREITNPALSLDTLGKFGTANVMNEWAARFLSVFPERNKADLDEFIQQVRNYLYDHVSNSLYNCTI